LSLHVITGKAKGWLDTVYDYNCRDMAGRSHLRM